jgi:ABC-2 type transport system permease protein
MRAEVAKLRYLPLPRWTAATLAAAVLITGIVLLVVGPSNPDKYIDTPSQVTSYAAWISTLIFGVWLSTLEFSSGTMQRTLTAEPSRGRVLSAKLTVTLTVAAVAGLAAAAAMGGLAHLAANHAGVTIDSSDLAGALFGQAPEAVSAAAIGFACGLLTRSLGGGIALGVLFLLVFDGVVSFIPGLKDFTYGQLTQDLSSGITGTGDTKNGLAVAIVGTVAWCVLLLTPGWVRFLRADLK